MNLRLARSAVVWLWAPACGSGPELQRLRTENASLRRVLDARSTELEALRSEQSTATSASRRARERAGWAVCRGGDATVLEVSLPRELPSLLDSAVRMRVVHEDSSGPQGYQLSGVRKQGLVAQLGFRNGDIVHTVNGQPLSGRALQSIYARLRDSTVRPRTLQVVYTRGAALRSMSIEVVEPGSAVAPAPEPPDTPRAAAPAASDP